MKRKIGIAIGGATLGTALCLGSFLWGQTGTAPTGGTAPAHTAAPRTPVRIINMNYVLQNYNRWLNFKEEYKANYKKLYEEQIESRKKRLQDLATQMQSTQATQQQKEAAEKEAKKLQREMQEVSDDAKQTLGKQEAEMIVKIYKEVEDAVRGYAVSASVELVMIYTDAMDEPELHSAANIGRKISSGGCFPLCYSPGMDISAGVLSILNSRVPKLPTTAGTTGTVPSGTSPRPGTQPINQTNYQPGTVPQPQGVPQPPQGFPQQQRP